MPSSSGIRDQQRTLVGMIRLFEDTLVRTTSNVIPTIDFDPVLVVDMRRNHFDAFVLSLRSDGTLHRLPRPVKIEEAESIAAARDRTPMCAYRKQRASTWTACSLGRLQQLRTDSGIEVVENTFEYILSLPETDRNKTFERLWFAFLSLLSETDSGQDYKRVLFVVDSECHQPLLQAVLPRVGARLDKNSGTKWQSAMIAVINAEMNIAPYAFLNDPFEADRTDASYLLLSDAKTGHAFHYDGSEMRSVHLNGRVDFQAYDRILVLGMEDTACKLSHVQIVNDTCDFEEMCLNGYINWWSRIDDARLDILRAKQDKLRKQLEQAQHQNSYLQQLVDRMSKTLNYLVANRG